jgi:zinc transporter
MTNSDAHGPQGPHYGGDAAGLICGYLLGEGLPVQAIDSAQAAAWLQAHALAQDAAPGPFLWLHFNLSHAQAGRWIERHAALPGTFFEALREGAHSTRIERDDDTLIAVLNDVHFDFAFEPLDVATLWIGVTPRLVITARTQPLRSVDALRTAVRDGRSPRSSAALLEQLMRTQADGLVGIVRGVTQRIDRVEDEMLSGRLDHKHARLGVLRRLLVRLQRLLAPEPAALFRLLQRPPAWMTEDDAQELRDASEEFSVVLRDMQGLQERVKLLQEEVAAIVQEANGRSLFVLTVVTVLALPINILAGLFGMNVGGIPLADNGHGFWIIVALVAAFTAVAGWLALRDTRE